MTTTEIEPFVTLDPVVVLPTAAVEQHGPHLPLSTDVDIGLGLLRRAFHHLPADFPAAALPALTCGASLEHERFAGTLSIPTDLLREMVYHHGRALHRSGVRRVVLSNSHGGNVAALHDAGLRLRNEFGMLVVKANYFLSPPPDTVALPESEWRHGLHGGAVETAMMLHLHPESVKRELAGNWRSLGETLDTLLREIRPEDFGATFSWLAGDLHTAGTVGNATLADATMGARLVDHYAERLAGVIRDAKTFPIDTLR